MEHISVLLNELIDSLSIKKDGIYIDMTLGGGGHAKEVLKRLEGGLLIGIDQDDYAIERAEENLKDFTNKKIIKSNFENINEILANLNIDLVDGIYFDLGVSSFQFDDKERGFSYNKEAVLDMRMDRERELSALKVVNEFSYEDIEEIIYKYGEERFAKSIARRIVEEREKNKITKTTLLSEIIKFAIPRKFQDKHPAKRTFQALRIYVNDELNVLEKSLDKSVEHLKKGGRISVISFHSLEDRIVKNKFKEYENPCTCPKNMPCVCHKVSKGKIINKKVIIPSEEELLNNNRAHSAKLRIFERI